MQDTLSGIQAAQEGPYLLSYRASTILKLVLAQGRHADVILGSVLRLASAEEGTLHWIWRLYRANMTLHYSGGVSGDRRMAIKVKPLDNTERILLQEGSRNWQLAPRVDRIQALVGWR